MLKKVLFSFLAAAVTAAGLSAQNGKTAIAAHRGFWNCEEAGYAQNSIKALQLAQENGFWGSEFDVQLTSDDIPIVNHNNEIEGVVIWDHKYEDYKDMRLKNGETIPTLDEYLTQGERCATTMLVFELKGQKNEQREDRLVELSIEALKKHGLYDPSRVMFITFSHHMSMKLAAIAPEFTNQYLGSEIQPDQLFSEGINGVDFHHSVFRKHPDWYTQARNNGMSVNIWTVDKEKDLEYVIGLRPDCITTNVPLRVRELLGTEENRNASVKDGDNPLADPKAVVVAGNARFTVLTSKLIRMEWSEDGKFEDRASLGIVNRKLPVPAYSVKKSGKKVIINTDDVTLTYSGPAKFDENNLSVVFTMPDNSGKKPVQKKITWKPGADESGNLLGTTRTLDGCDGIKTKEPFDLGVASRDGWAVIDESSRQLFQPVESDWKNWVAQRPEGERQDLYIFAYGHDYKSAVSDFTKIAGRIPLPPKYSLGYWWCRYWQYSDFEFTDLAKEIRSFNIPADIMVIDMDWHETWTLRKKNSPTDETGQRVGWTGYTWQNQLFPDAAGTLAELHNLKYKTTLNLHPASGIQPNEEPYERFVKDYLSRTSDYDGPEGYIYKDDKFTFKGNDPAKTTAKAGQKAPVAFRIDQEAWANAYFNSVIRPFERQGVDFWWLDWQQWRESKYTEGLSNTFWLNYTFFNDMLRQSASEGIYARRPMIYHRWGGIGSHRYQIGFSGDTYASWQVLGYLPYFTSTASNVGYGYWGHDIGGHMQPKGVESTDPELYTRWLQGGVFTPIFKTHSTKNMTMEKRFWQFPDHLDAMRDAIRLRYDLSPYIYTAARQTTDTGISMCRPLYYYYPEAQEAYDWKQEFMFGDNILATVVCQAADPVTGLASRDMWFPQGNDWYDVATGTIYAGGQVKKLSYTVDENPWYIKTAAVIPMAGKDITSLQDASNELRLFVAPGNGSTGTSVYEDDGATQAYREEYATTKISNTATDGKTTVKLAAREGSYSGAPATRKVTVLFASVLAPVKVTVNGEEVPYSRFAQKDAAEGKLVWGYEGKDLTAVVYVPEKAVSEELAVECEFPETDRALLNGKKGIMHRMMAITPETKLVFGKYIDAYMMLPDPFLKLAQCSSFILSNPAKTSEYLGNMDAKATEDCLKSFEKMPESFVQKVKAQCEL